VWWVNLSNGIPANSNVTIYMYIGPTSANYYQQYYPYVGTNAQVIGTMQYDNGQDVFIAYGYFEGVSTISGPYGYYYLDDGWYIYVISGDSPGMSSGGIFLSNYQPSIYQPTYSLYYLLPPSICNIPKIPLIVEEAWYYYRTYSGDANVIALFGNTNQQIYAEYIGNTSSYSVAPTSNLSTFVQFNYYSGVTYLKSAVTNSTLNQTSFPTSGGTVYSYLIVNSSYAQTGYYIYNSNQVLAPLTLLDTYNINYNNYTYSNLNYNPFQYGTLEIGAGTGGATSVQYIQWIVARAYPPNGIMPSISTGSESSWPP